MGDLALALDSWVGSDSACSRDRPRVDGSVTDASARLGDVIGRMKVKQEHPEDDVIDNDLILVWGKQKRIITGADLLGRLLRGITTRETKST